MSITVVCPLTGRPSAERALASAFDAAGLLGGAVELFSAVEDIHVVGRRRSYLEQTSGRRRTTNDQIVTNRIVVDPHAPRALGERSCSPDVMTVMATSTQPLLHAGYVGSAAERTTRQAWNPTLLIGPHNTIPLRDVGRVVVACDGSKLSERAIADGQAWADRLDVSLWLVTSLSPSQTNQPDSDHQIESNYVRGLAKDLDAEWDVLHGHDPAKSIAEWAGDALIVVTTHGRSGFSRIAVGSVATGITRWASGPVLVANGQRAVTTDSERPSM